jgi:vacuolar-type H+-ATPase subunit H
VRKSVTELVPKKKEAAAEKEPEKAPKKAPQLKAEVSDKTAKKIEKAEDEYEKYLRTNMLDAEMGGEAYRQEALGFALMKFGARAMQAR